jgi:transcriptional regulator with XRE-family HTH domain
VIPLELGELIRQKRLEKGFTQEELGAMVGVQASAINKYEKGRVSNMGRSTISKLSKILGISPLEFFDEVFSTPASVSRTKKELIAFIDDLPDDQVEKLLQIAKTVFEK